jgi:hypothetical protein
MECHRVRDVQWRVLCEGVGSDVMLKEWEVK